MAEHAPVTHTRGAWWRGLPWRRVVHFWRWRRLLRSSATARAFARAELDGRGSPETEAIAAHHWCPAVREPCTCRVGCTACAHLSAAQVEDLRALKVTVGRQLQVLYRCRWDGREAFHDQIAAFEALFQRTITRTTR